MIGVDGGLNGGKGIARLDVTGRATGSWFAVLPAVRTREPGTAARHRAPILARCPPPSPPA